MAEVIDLKESARQREIQRTGELYSQIAEKLFADLGKAGLSPTQVTQFLGITTQLWAGKMNEFLNKQKVEDIV